MNDLQLANLSISDVPRTPPLKLVDLPEEVRLMIYRYAFQRELVKRSFPAFLSVSSHIRKEATPIFYRESRFVLKLQPQPDTRSTVLNFNGKTREWFAFIGSDNINDLRHVAFSFPGTRHYYPYNEYRVDLSCRDAGTWTYTHRLGPDNHFNTLQRDLEEAENDTDKEEIAKFLAELGSPIDDAYMAYLKNKGIEKCKHALRRAQRAMDSFSDGCGEGRFVKPTLEGLEVLGRVLIRVEKARVYFNHQ